MLIVVIMAISALAFAIANIPSAAGEAQGKMAPIHLNFKDVEKFSPETIGDPMHEAVEYRPPRSWNTPATCPGDTCRQREWRDVGTWTADGILFDVTIKGPVRFNLWWMEDPGSSDDYDAQAQFRWSFRVNDIEYASHEDDNDQDSQGEPHETTSQATLVSMDLLKSDVLSIYVEYQAFDDIFVYYDNASLDSGLTLEANAVVPLRGGGSGGKIKFEYVEAWSVDEYESLEGNFLTVLAGGTTLSNVDAYSEDGTTYEINNASVTSKIIIWNGGGSDPTVSFSYTKNESNYADPIQIPISSLDSIGGGGGDDDSPGLGFGGAIIGLAAVSIYLTRRRR